MTPSREEFKEALDEFVDYYCADYIRKASWVMDEPREHDGPEDMTATVTLEFFRNIKRTLYVGIHSGEICIECGTDGDWYLPLDHEGLYCFLWNETDNDVQNLEDCRRRVADALGIPGTEQQPGTIHGAMIEKARSLHQAIRELREALATAEDGRAPDEAYAAAIRDKRLAEAIVERMKALVAAGLLTPDQQRRWDATINAEAPDGT